MYDVLSFQDGLDVASEKTRECKKDTEEEVHECLKEFAGYEQCLANPAFEHHRPGKFKLSKVKWLFTFELKRAVGYLLIHILLEDFFAETGDQTRIDIDAGHHTYPLLPLPLATIHRGLYNRRNFLLCVIPPILGAFYNNEKICFLLILNRLFLNNVKVESFV